MHGLDWVPDVIYSIVQFQGNSPNCSTRSMIISMPSQNICLNFTHDKPCACM